MASETLSPRRARRNVPLQHLRHTLAPKPLTPRSALPKHCAIFARDLGRADCQV